MLVVAQAPPRHKVLIGGWRAQAIASANKLNRESHAIPPIAKARIGEVGHATTNAKRWGSIDHPAHEDKNRVVPDTDDMP